MADNKGLQGQEALPGRPASGASAATLGDSSYGSARHPTSLQTALQLSDPGHAKAARAHHQGAYRIRSASSIQHQAEGSARTSTVTNLCFTTRKTQRGTEGASRSSHSRDPSPLRPRTPATLPATAPPYKPDNRPWTADDTRALALSELQAPAAMVCDEELAALLPRRTWKSVGDHRR